MTDIITSKSNTQIKNIKRLLESSSERRKKGLFVIEGIRICKDAPKERIEQLYVSESFLDSKTDFPINEFKDYMVVSDEVFKSITDTVNPQGVLAIVGMENHDLTNNALPESEGKLYLVLDDIQDPGNLGTIIRTAEAAGVNTVFMSKGCVDLYNPKVIRSTMGSIFRMNFVVTNLTDAISKLKEKKVKVCAASLDATKNYNEIDKTNPVAYIIGNEANGISDEVMEAADELVKIPMKGEIESLNAAVSAAILLYC